MSEVKSPPKFSSTKDYQTYKRELTSWTKVTKHDKKQWGSIVALSLPENDPSDIRRKVFAGVDIDADDGYDKLIAYLDELTYIKVQLFRFFFLKVNMIDYFFECMCMWMVKRAN